MLRALATVRPRTVFALTFAALLAWHARALLDPPYWDALIGAFPQAHWLAQHDFDLARLVASEPRCLEGGPNVYPFSVYPLLIAALYALSLPPKLVFLAVHLLVLASAAGAATAFFALARERLPPLLGLLATLLLVGSPLFQSLASQMNMDMPLCACGLAALLALVRRRFGWAFLAALLALLLIPRGVILVAANASFLGWLAIRRDPERRRVLGWTLAHVLLLAIFAAEVEIARAYENLPAHVGMLQGFRHFFRVALWTIPEFGVVFLAALACALAVLLRALRGRARALDLACALHLLVFVLVYGQYKNTLPRYFLQIYPCAILLVLGAAPAAGRVARLVPAVVSLAIAANAVNHAGALYHDHGSGWRLGPGVSASPLSADGHLLERSMKYRQDLLLGLEVARYLERFDRERVTLVATWPLAQALAIPEFGYVERAWTVSSRPQLAYDPRAVSFYDLYDLTGGGMRAKTDAEILWVVVPNVYQKPHLAPREGDEVLAVLEHGDFRAFVFRRGDRDGPGGK